MTTDDMADTYDGQRDHYNDYDSIDMGASDGDIVFAALAKGPATYIYIYIYIYIYMYV